MNLFNRIVMIILLLLGIATSIFLIFAALLAPEGGLESLRETIDFLEENLSLGLQILVASVAALAAIVGFLFLLLEVVPRGAKGVELTGVSGASAWLTVDAIVNRIRYEVESVPGVRQVKPTVTPKGRTVDVSLELFTDPTVDVAAKAEEVSGIVRDTVENKMGGKLRNLKVNVRQAFYPKEAKGKEAAPQPPPSETRSIDTR